MLAALPVRPAPAEGELQRRRGRPGRHPAARPRRQPPLLRERRGARGPRRLQGEAPARTSAGSPGGRDGRAGSAAPRGRAPAVGDGREAAHAAGGGGAGARRHRAGRHRGRVPAARVRVRADRQRLHPDRHEPVERLLGRPPRRRHRGSARPGTRHRRRTDAAAAGARGDVRGLRDRGGGRRVPHRHRRLAAARGRRGLDTRRRALHRRAAAVRLRGARRAVRVPVLRDRGGGRLLLRADRGARLGGVRAVGAGRDCWPRRSWW